MFLNHQIAKESASVFATQFDISPTRPEDAEAIRSIMRGVGAFDDDEVKIGDELVLAYLSQGALTSGYHFLSCRLNGRVMGFACYGPHPLTHGGTFDLYWIAVDKSVQGRGVGQALLRRVAQEVQTAGGRLIIAETSGRMDYLPTRRFYETHGYQRAATIPDFYALGDDLVMYVQRLLPGSTPGEDCAATPSAYAHHQRAGLV